MAQKQKKKDKNAKGSAAGRNNLKCAQYAGYEHQMLIKERKLCKILKSNGPKAAKQWAERNGVTGMLHKLTCDSGKIAQLASEALK